METVTDKALIAELVEALHAKMKATQNTTYHAEHPIWEANERATKALSTAAKMGHGKE